MPMHTVCGVTEVEVSPRGVNKGTFPSQKMTVRVLSIHFRVSFILFHQAVENQNPLTKLNDYKLVFGIQALMVASGGLPKGRG